MPTMTATKNPKAADDAGLAAAETMVAAYKDQDLPVALIGTPIGEMPQRFVFTSEHKVGWYRGHTIHFDPLNPKWVEPDDTPDSRRDAKLHKQAWERRYTEEAQAMLNQAALELGTNQIVFNYTSGPEMSGQASTGWIWYATDSEAIAWVVRNHIETGLLPHVKEIKKDKIIRVGEKVFANNTLGQKLAFAEAEATDESLELVARTG